MDNMQALEIIDIIKGQWPQWKTSETEEEVYCKSLRPFDFQTTKESVSKHKVSKEGGGLSPKLYHILEILKTRGKTEKKTNKPVISYYAECIENEKQRWRVGEKMPFYAQSKEKAYRGDLQHKSALRACEKTRISQGGTWIPRLINFDIEQEFDYTNQ